MHHISHLFWTGRFVVVVVKDKPRVTRTVKRMAGGVYACFNPRGEPCQIGVDIIDRRERLVIAGTGFSYSSKLISLTRIQTRTAL
jgi:hypothetical protein